MFGKLLASVEEGRLIAKGKLKASRVFNLKNPDVKAIRKSYHLSQSKFARLLGISVGTLKNWEQGRCKPEGPARVLLGVAAKHPEVLPDVVG